MALLHCRGVPVSFAAHADVSLHLVSIAPFVLQIFTAVGLTGYLSIRNGQRAVNDVASQLRQEITARMIQHLDNYLAIPHAIRRFGFWNPENMRAMTAYFTWQLDQLRSRAVSYRKGRV